MSNGMFADEVGSALLNFASSCLIGLILKKGFILRETWVSWPKHQTYRDVYLQYERKSYKSRTNEEAGREQFAISMIRKLKRLTCVKFLHPTKRVTEAGES